MRYLIGIAFLFIQVFCSGQENGFGYGKATYRELEMSGYELDPDAPALVLDEFGEAFINKDFNLQFLYHARIKIFKTEGLDQAVFEIPLRKSEGRVEKLISVRASAYNVENGSMRETKLESKNVFTENVSKYLELKKFAIPNVRVGSVIEVLYVLESPFIFNFREWNFQSDIPKLKSEYFCTIPGIYHYNISLKGYLKLTTNKSELVTSCFSSGGQSADCANLRYGMVNVPAFKEEDYMTARSNFLSAINFELSQINYFDGRKDKITKEWKDADDELRAHSDFGLQIKRGQDVVSRQLKPIIEGETDQLVKAKKIYDFIKEWYRWNEHYSKYAEFGIKKAFETKSGNVGDINLSLIAGLKYADIQVEPVLLSTRENGLPTELYPVLSDFDYVIAKVVIEGKTYLLDATEPLFPFGLLPERCLNGKGRALGEKESYWQELIPAEKERTISIATLTLAGGDLRGNIRFTYSGYAAVNERKKILKYSNLTDYIADVKSRLHDATIQNFTVENANDPYKPLIINMDVAFVLTDLLSTGTLYFNPFIGDYWKRNPFKSTERSYPVDFGAPLEENFILNLTYPEDFVLEEIPSKVALKLPANGGHFTFEIKDFTNKLSMTNTLVIAKPVFSSQEYHYLKELFNNVVSTGQTQLVFKQKK